MKLSGPGKITSKAEVQDISAFGVWLYAGGKEFFMSYERCPWFKDATVAEISNVEFLFGHHLHWPDLDVDLDLDCLEHPERYPLSAKYIPRRDKRKKAA